MGSVRGEHIMSLYLYGTHNFGEANPQQSETDFLVITIEEFHPPTQSLIQYIIQIAYGVKAKDNQKDLAPF